MPKTAAKRMSAGRSEVCCYVQVDPSRARSMLCSERTAKRIMRRCYFAITCTHSRNGMVRGGSMWARTPRTCVHMFGYSHTRHDRAVLLPLFGNQRQFSANQIPELLAFLSHSQHVMRKQVSCWELTL